ncbi:MAG: cupredoxin domain-containing protein [Nitrososphaerota archaeon]|nr:cupredoxin domain-containing protein [Nitrososphaerota archaeon]
MKLEQKRSGIGTGAVVAALIVVILIAAAAYLIFVPGTTPSTSSTTSTTTGTSPTTTTSTTSTTSAPGTVTVIMPLGVGTNQSLNFQPSAITVVVGVNNTIVFKDEDTPVPHNVWFLSVPAGATNPNTAAGQSSYYQLSDGQSVTYTLTTPGTYDYNCQFHPAWMKGTITVVASGTTSTTSSTTSTTSTTSITTSTTSSTTSTTSSSASVAAVAVVIPQGAGSGLNFSPSKITVVVGVNSTVNFVDQDSLAPHNVWFTSIPSGATNPNTAAGQSSGYVMLKGQSVSYTLTTPGTYDYNCQFHSSWMQGVITVVAAA